LTFVSQAAFDAGIGEQLKLNKPVVAVKNMRNLRKRDMIHNGATPKMEVDPKPMKCAPMASCWCANRRSAAAGAALFPVLIL
jgi:urease alpha subunit